MVCPKCGKKNKKDEIKCVVCGKKLITKKTKGKKDESNQDGLLESITSTIDVKAIKKAQKSLLSSLKKMSPKIIVSVVVSIVVVITLIFMSIGFNSVSCVYQSDEDNWLFRSNINFNYKKDEVTRLSMRLEYSADSNKYKDEFNNIYNNILGNLKGFDNYKSIVKASKSKRHFSIVYNFAPKYIDQIEEYTGININNYETIDEFVNSLEQSGFRCN